MEWTDGILLNQTTGLRQWPLKVLEHRKKAEAKQHKVPWRMGGSKVRGEVNERLTIIYAILRQIYETHSSEGIWCGKAQFTSTNQSVHSALIINIGLRTDTTCRAHCAMHVKDYHGSTPCHPCFCQVCILQTVRD